MLVSSTVTCSTIINCFMKVIYLCKNNKGPRTEPWGTPNFIICWYLIWIHLLTHKMLWSTVSNAFCKSIKMPTAKELSSRALLMSSVKSNNILMTILEKDFTLYLINNKTRQQMNVNICNGLWFIMCWCYHVMFWVWFNRSWLERW